MRGAFVRPARVVLRRRYRSKSHLPDRLSTLLGRTRWGFGANFQIPRTKPPHHMTREKKILKLAPTASKLFLQVISFSNDLRGGRGRCALRRSHPCNDICKTTPFPAKSTRFLGGEHLFSLSHPSPPEEPHDFPTMVSHPCNDVCNTTPSQRRTHDFSVEGTSFH